MNTKHHCKNSLVLYVAVAILTFLILTSHEKLVAEFHWTKHQSGTIANLRGLWFVDSSRGWVCGDSGTILHTTDGGDTWLSQSSNVNVLLEDIFFRDTLDGWICGDSGTILHTTDGGLAWNKRLTSVHSHLYKIQFTTSENGMATGDRSTILDSYDSGRTWHPESHSDSGTALVIFKWIDETRGVFALSDTSARTLYHTIDGGITWGLTGHPSYLIKDIAGYRAAYPEEHYRDFYWDVGARGFVVWVMVLEDGNPAQAYARIGQTGDTLNLNSVTLAQNSLDMGTLWAVGNHGWVITSSDSGLSWQTIQSGVTVDLFNVIFLSHNLGWAIGDSGTILQYHNTTGVVDQNKNFLPSLFFLYEPYPNPFNSESVIQYEISETMPITLQVVDVLGREIMLLYEGKQFPGNYSVYFKGENLPSGIYYIRFTAGTHTSLKKLLLMK